MIEEAVILAAGKGTRLRDSEDALPKPLTEVGGMPLVKRVIQSLAGAGIRRVVVVTGFMAERVRAALENDADYARWQVTLELAHNPEFELANGVSVITGGARCNGPFLLSMADHLYTRQIPQLLARCDLAAADLYLATDPRIDTILDIDDATKVATEHGRIIQIGKQLTTYDRIDCGVFAVGPALLEALAAERRERGDCSLSDGVRRLAQAGRARVVDIGNAAWQDVDTHADREHAERNIVAKLAES